MSLLFLFSLDLDLVILEAISPEPIIFVMPLIISDPDKLQETEIPLSYTLLNLINTKEKEIFLKLAVVNIGISPNSFKIPATLQGL